MSQARILLVQHGANRGGATLSLLQLARALRDSGKFSPYLLFSSEGPMAERIRGMGFPVSVHPVGALMTGVSVKFRFVMLARFLLELPIALSRIGSLNEEKDIELIYLNTSALLGSAMAARIKKVATIWHIREVMPVQTLVGRLERDLICRLATTIVTNSKYVAGPFLKKHPNVQIVYNGVSVDVFQKHESDWLAIRRELGIPEDVPLVGLVGVISHIKGHFVLVDAIPHVLRRVPNAKFLIVGASSIPEGYGRTWRGRLRRLRGEAYDPVEKLKHTVRQKGLEGVVYFTGWRDDVPAILSAIDVAVFPSIIAEGFGRPLIEAGAAAKPVVASNIGPATEIVANGKTGLLVSPQNSGELAAALTKILLNPNLAHTMGRAGRERVARFFSEENYTKSMISVFRQTLSVSKRGE